jgi:aldehyde dehydrogenase (NAD+)/glyceraldehyde-3-phosphate dehydrogenase (NADP+)
MVANSRVDGAERFAVRHPFDDSLVAEVSVPGEADVERAIAAAADAFGALAAAPAHVRSSALAHVARRLGEEREEFARTITAESGKPIRWARIEVGRAAANFQTAAEEAKRLSGDMVRLDGDPVGEGRVGWVRRFPIGPVLGITPFNFPLNLVTHKIAPALAVGAPIVLKPAPQTPLTAVRLAELIAETELPAGSVSVLTLPNGPALDALVADPRLPIVSFTGSEVGWRIKAAHPRKRVLLELGGNAAAVVHVDADLQAAVGSVAAGGFVQAGQTCISTQRVLVHEDVADDFTAGLVERTQALRTGDPFDEETFVGPMVSEAAAHRVETWIADAVAGGAGLLCGGERAGTTVAPAVLSDVAPDRQVWRDEAFGPVLALATYREIDDAFRRVNDSRFGLQAGVFTSDLELALRAHRELVVGTVMIGDSPSYRADALPYGGWKDSGMGREGVRFAMAELTDARGLVLRGL